MIIFGICIPGIGISSCNVEFWRWSRGSDDKQQGEKPYAYGLYRNLHKLQLLPLSQNRHFRFLHFLFLSIWDESISMTLWGRKVVKLCMCCLYKTPAFTRSKNHWKTFTVITIETFVDCRRHFVLHFRIIFRNFCFGFRTGKENKTSKSFSRNWFPTLAHTSAEMHRHRQPTAAQAKLFIYSHFNFYFYTKWRFLRRLRELCDVWLDFVDVSKAQAN